MSLSSMRPSSCFVTAVRSLFVRPSFPLRSFRLYVVLRRVFVVLYHPVVRQYRRTLSPVAERKQGAGHSSLASSCPRSGVGMKRLREGKPEAHATEAAAYYDAPTAHTYTHGVVWNKGTQADLTRTVCTLAHVAPHTLVLDVGCGSGLSTRAVIETVLPAPACVGFDVAAAMLDIAVTTVSGAEFAMCDAGAGLPLRAGVFDSGISVSALQWLMGSGGVIDTAPFSRCMATVMSALQPGAVCAFQAYFDSPAMAEAALVTLATLGMARPTLILDFPHSNHNRKFFVRAVKPPLQPTVSGAACVCVCGSLVSYV